MSASGHTANLIALTDSRSSAITRGVTDINLAALIGSNIRSARLASGLTQGQLAAKVGLTSFMGVSRWETGRGQPSSHALVRLSEVLHRDIAWFYADHDAEQAA